MRLIAILFFSAFVAAAFCFFLITALQSANHDGIAKIVFFAGVFFVVAGALVGVVWFFKNLSHLYKIISRR